MIRMAPGCTSRLCIGGCDIADVVRRLVEVKEAIENLGRELGAPPERTADLADELSRLALVTLSPALQTEQTATPQPDVAVARPAADPPAMLTVIEMAKRLGISRTTAYELVHAGRIPYVRFGRLIRVPSAALDERVMREARERS